MPFPRNREVNNAQFLKYIRRVLIQAAQRVLNMPHMTMTRWANSTHMRSKPRAVRVTAVARKICVALFHMTRNREEFKEKSNGKEGVLLPF